MRIEAFSEGKNLDDPAANEDQFLVLPGRGFAVIDGVTDITGRLFDGMRSGRLASGIVQQAAASFLTDVCDGEFCGTQAWQWIDKNVGHQDKLKANPKWAFVPRGNQSSEVLQAFSRSRVQQFKPKAVAIAKKKKK